MFQNSKKLEGHIAFESFVHSFVRSFVTSSSLAYGQERIHCMSFFFKFIYDLLTHCKTKNKTKTCEQDVSKTIHYENMPIQIFSKFYHQKMKIIR